MIDYKKRVCVVDRKRNSIIASIIKDSVTFSYLIFCIYLSHDSKWWTFVTGTMFFSFTVAKLYNVFKLNSNQFDSKDDLEKWVKGLDW